MQERNVYSMRMLGSQNHSPCEATSGWPAPELRFEKKLGWLKACNSVIVLLLLVALAGLVLGICYLYQLQQQVNQMKQKINGSPQNKAEMQTEAEEKIKPKDDVKMAAHLTGKPNGRSNRMMWEPLLGHAFTQGITYTDGALIINETGQYFIYSKIYFRGRQCEAFTLQQTVFKRNNNYQNDLSLMEVKMINYCFSGGGWDENTFQAGIFLLGKGEQLFVKVSHPGMVSADELLTFFGLYKL
uniref:tumor necrosis factor ligand superfamily member 6-like n=1 Tax=Pristiophorus japonicus TaxID=55135 RepID=UPI00398E7012